MSKYTPHSKSNPTPNEEWESFWKPLCTNGDGSLNLEAIKNELSDYSFLLEQVPTVYENVSGGRISKPNTYAFEVVAAADELYDAKYTEGYQDALEEHGIEEPTNA